MKFKQHDHIWAYGYKWVGQHGYIMARYCGKGMHTNWLDIEILFPKPLTHIPALSKELVGFISRPIQR